MKTSVIEVRDMLSVLSVSGVEERIGEVPGVESVTVNYSAGSATVRYDETRLDVSDIKSDVRRHASEADPLPGVSAMPDDKAQPMADMPQTMPAPAPAGVKAASGKPTAAGATPAGAIPKDDMAQATASTPAPNAGATVAAPAAADGNESPPKG